MNRIRKYNDHYQVLITPKYISPDSSLLFGNWLNPEFRMLVLDVNTLEQAQNIALEYSDIIWDKIILDHIYIYKNLFGRLTDLVNANELPIFIKPNILSGIVLKNMFFNFKKTVPIIYFNIETNKYFAETFMSILKNENKVCGCSALGYGQSEIKLRLYEINKIKSVNKTLYIIKGKTELQTSYEIHINVKNMYFS